MYFETSIFYTSVCLVIVGNAAAVNEEENESGQLWKKLLQSKDDVDFKIASDESKGVGYEGAQVWRTPLLRRADIDLFKKMNNKDLSLWHIRLDRADYLVRPENKVSVFRTLRSARLNHSVLVLNVQRYIDEQKPRPLELSSILRKGFEIDWKSYPTPDVIEEYLNYLVENFPSICKLQNIGYTVENRSIQMITVSNGNPDNKVVVLTSGMHAREWIAITSVLYILNKIVNKFDNLPNYLKNKDWVLIPVLNPDGFVYTHEKDRFWRKNRRKNKDCYGVDINRNFDTDWNTLGASTDECADDYAGPSALSEAETIALRDAVLKAKKKPHALVDFHCYGELILYPWASRKESTESEKLHRTVAQGMSKTIFTISNHKYGFGTPHEWNIPASGTAVDSIYACGVPQVYTIEASSRLQGFLTPPSEIENIGKELLAAIIFLAKTLDPSLLRKDADCHTWF